MYETEVSDVMDINCLSASPLIKWLLKQRTAFMSQQVDRVQTIFAR